eukprot:753095-Hanusia_phi.AAC.1
MAGRAAPGPAAVGSDARLGLRSPAAPAVTGVTHGHSHVARLPAWQAQIPVRRDSDSEVPNLLPSSPGSSGLGDSGRASRPGRSPRCDWIGPAVRAAVGPRAGAARRPPLAGSARMPSAALSVPYRSTADGPI